MVTQSRSIDVAGIRMRWEEAGTVITSSRKRSACHWGLGYY